MSTIQIHLTPEVDALIQRQLESGQFRDVSEVIEAGIHLLAEEQDDESDEQKLAALRLALQEADESENAPPGVFDRLREYIRSTVETSSTYAPQDTLCERA